MHLTLSTITSLHMQKYYKWWCSFPFPFKLTPQKDTLSTHNTHTHTHTRAHTYTAFSKQPRYVLSNHHMSGFLKGLQFRNPAPKTAELLHSCKVNSECEACETWLAVKWMPRHAQVTSRKQRQRGIIQCTASMEPHRL